MPLYPFIIFSHPPLEPLFTRKKFHFFTFYSKNRRQFFFWSSWRGPPKHSDLHFLDLTQKIFEPAVMAANRQANRWESDGESSDDDDDELPKRKKRCLPSPTRASSRPGGVRQWAYGRMTKSWKHYQTHLPRPRGWPRRRTWWRRECGYLESVEAPGKTSFQ